MNTITSVVTIVGYVHARSLLIDIEEHSFTKKHVWCG